MVNWKGVYPALTTPFDGNDHIDTGAFRKHVQFQMDAGVDGLIIGGSLGEASTLTLDEKRSLLDTAVSVAAGRVPVIMNIAEGSTRDALATVAMAHHGHADGFMALPPMRYKSDERETVTYFKAIAAATSLPVMLYNNPVDYKIEITLDMFGELQSCSNIEAVKESTRDVTNVTRMRNRFGDRFRILCGVDTLAMEELLLGADGWVAGLVNAFPAETVAIYRLIQHGAIEEAKRIYRWFMPLLELDIHPKLVQYIKLAQAEAGVGSESVRAPRLMLDGAERQRILQIIRTGIGNRPQFEMPGAIAEKTYA